MRASSDLIVLHGGRAPSHCLMLLRHVTETIEKGRKIATEVCRSLTVLEILISLDVKVNERGRCWSCLRLFFAPEKWDGGAGCGGGGNESEEGR